MPCYRSLYVYKGKEPNLIPVKVPCGQCIGCRLEKARQWAVRCCHEAQMHDQNCFITLTYNNDNLPKNKSISKRDLQLFFKRLRRAIKKPIRYYACGEYGDRFNRPHYHIALFGYDFIDKELLYANTPKIFNNRFKSGPDHTLYRSAMLEKIWKKGFASIGSLTFESAGYVARYVTKRITGNPAKDHYKGKTPEFALMSRRPGIGRTWLEKYKTDVYPKDFFTLRGRRMRPPRYYDTILEGVDPQQLETIKERREQNVTDYTAQRKKSLDKYKNLIAKQLNRSFEDETD